MWGQMQYPEITSLYYFLRTQGKQAAHNDTRGFGGPGDRFGHNQTGYLQIGPICLQQVSPLALERSMAQGPVGI